MHFNLSRSSLVFPLDKFPSLILLVRNSTRPVRVGNTQHDNKENARPWENDDSHSNESDRVAAKLARKESLNIKLALRPDRQELINRYIRFLNTLLTL